MPVARIISSSFEDALKFADYLRPLFDTVEIAQPGRASDTAVDLEVNLELCNPQEAWLQIAQLSRQPDSEIFVAPGTLFPEAQAGEQQAAETAVAAEAGMARTPQEFDSAGLELDAAIAQASAAAVSAAGSNGSGTHKTHSGTVPEPELNWLGRTRESLRQWLAVRALLREIRQMQQQEWAQQQQRQRQMALQFERERREREARELAAIRAAVPPPPATPEMEQQRQWLEEIPPAQLALQQQAREEELRRQAEQEEAIRRGQFVEQILRRRAQEQTAQAMHQAGALDAETAPVEFQAVPADSFAEAAEAAPALRFSGGRRGDRLRPAMALAGVTSVLLMAVLVGYANRRPASPVPLSVLQRSNEVEQKVPFGPAVLPVAQPPAAMPVMQASEEPSQESVPLPERHNFRSDFRRVRVDRHEVDYVADDVTVRHFNYENRRNTVRHPATPVPISASTRGVKQISDME